MTDSGVPHVSYGVTKFGVRIYLGEVIKCGSSIFSGRCLEIGSFWRYRDAADTESFSILNVFFVGSIFLARH